MFLAFVAFTFPYHLSIVSAIIAAMFLFNMGIVSPVALLADVTPSDQHSTISGAAQALEFLGQIVF